MMTHFARKRSLSGQRVLVVGLGESGYATARWCIHHQAQVRVIDTRPHPPYHQSLREKYPDTPIHCGPFRPQDLLWSDTIVLSPGVAPHTLPYPVDTLPCVSEIELFSWSTPQQPIVAITGSNGKTTTASLVGTLLKTRFDTVAVCGNISPAVLDQRLAYEQTNHPVDIWVLELSSFQLAHTYSMTADSAAVLNICEDHLDWHSSFEHYWAAKERLLHQTQRAIKNYDDPLVMKMAPQHPHPLYFSTIPSSTQNDVAFFIKKKGHESILMHHDTEIIPTAQLRVSGQHNWSNALAALALCDSFALTPEAIQHSLQHWTILDHRMQLVACIRQVQFINDSKATNTGAAIAALRSVVPPIVLIAGGQGKQQDFTALAHAAGRCARAVVLIGEDAATIHAALQCMCPTLPCVLADTLPAAVYTACQLAKPHDTVLLSPACASTDMFRDYKQRGDVFIQTVRALT